MNETTKISLSKLLKLEVPEFIGHVVQILSRHNPEKLHLEGMYRLLLDQQSNATLLIDRYGPHDLTEPLNVMHAKRLSYASMIVSKLYNLDKPHFRETLDLVRTARPMVRYHLAYLGQQKRDTAHECIRALFIQLDDEPKIMEAMVALGFQSKLDKLKKANLEHEKLWMDRVVDKAKRPKVNTEQVKREVVKVLRWFFDQVDTCQKIYKEVDYGPLINELNVLSSRYSNLFAIREGVNKRKREKAKEAKEKEAKGNTPTTEANLKAIDMNAQPKAEDNSPTTKNDSTIGNGKKKTNTTNNSDNNKQKKTKPGKPPQNVKKALKPKRGRGKKR